MPNFILMLALFLLLSIGLRMIFEPAFLKKIIGLGLFGHAINLSLLLSGWTKPQYPSIGRAAFLGNLSFENSSDPLPQALILTAIVIGFALTGFLILFHLMSERENS